MNIFKLAGVVELVKVGDVGIDPKFGRWRKCAVLRGFIVAGDLLFDAIDLILIDVCIIGDKSKLARLGADALGYQAAEYGILGDVEW